MLLKSKQDFGYGGSYGITQGKLYVGYAIDETKTSISVAVYPFSPGKELQEVDPLFYPMGKFDLLADRTSSTWSTNTFQDISGHVFRSFPEFFIDSEMCTRMSDWSLTDQDYPIIKKYKTSYEALYSDLI